MILVHTSSKIFVFYSLKYIFKSIPKKKFLNKYKLIKIQRHNISQQI